MPRSGVGVWLSVKVGEDVRSVEKDGGGGCCFGDVFLFCFALCEVSEETVKWEEERQTMKASRP
jgi:hypothetical protein